MLIYAIAATSLNLMLGYGGMVSFGHAAFFGAGAYSTGILISEGVPAPGSPGRPRCWSPALAAALIGAISLRTRGVYFIMITLAFAQMMYYLFISLKAYGGDEGLTLPRALGPRLRPRSEDDVTLLLRRAGLARGVRCYLLLALRRLALRPRARRHPRERDARRGDRLSGVPLQAGLLRRSPARWPAWPARCSPTRRLRQPQRAALGAVGHADDHGDPGRRRRSCGAACSAPRCCCCWRRCCRPTRCTGSSGLGMVLLAVVLFAPQGSPVCCAARSNRDDLGGIDPAARSAR